MDQKIKNALGWLTTTLAAMLIIYVGLQIKTLYTSPVDITKIRTVTMSAEGKVTAKPDTATISFSVVTDGKQAEDVQKQNDQKMTRVIDFLKSKGLKEDSIQTSNYNLYPQYNYSQTGEPPVITGYTLNQQVTVKIKDLNAVKDITGGLTGQGVNQIENISYSIDDPDSLRAKAREQAIAKAKDKANDLARNLGVSLGKVVNFSEGQVGGPIPYPAAYDKGLGAGGGGPSPLQPGSQDVLVDVTLTFELK